MADAEPEHSERRDSRSTSVWRFLFRDRLPLERETCWFILANVLDFFATYLLIRKHRFEEANPVAGWFLEGWGPVKGLLAYKLSMVAFVCVIAQIIARKRLAAARRLLWFGTAVVGAVVLYSLFLLLRAG